MMEDNNYFPEEINREEPVSEQVPEGLPGQMSGMPELPEGSAEQISGTPELPEGSAEQTSGTPDEPRVPDGKLPMRIPGQPEHSSQRTEYRYHYGAESRADGMYGQGAYTPYHTAQPTSSFATAALIMGILSLMFAVLSGVGGIFLGALGIVFAVLSRGDERMPGQSRIGAGLSVGGMVLGVIVILALVSVISSGAFQREFQKELERYGVESGLPEDGGDDDFYRDFFEDMDPGDGDFSDNLPGI